MTLLQTFFCLVAAVAAIPAPQADTTTTAAASVCTGNTASDRSVWCDYSTDTDYYAEVPDTGVTVEVHIFWSYAGSDKQNRQLRLARSDSIVKL